MSQLLYGPTTPLQPAAPTPKDIVESEHMVEIIQRHSVVNRSAHVLSYVESVAYVMVTLCNLKRQQQQRIESGNGEEDGTTGSSAASNVESYPTWAKAFAFGSSGLEANVTSSDIDVLLVCPLTITPQLFLAAFPAILKQRGIEDAVTVSAARVPVVKFMLNDISVDVVCVSYASANAPAEKDFLPLSVFQCISKETRQSVQGFRTVLEIRRRIPVPLDVYSTTLRAIKFWAMQRKVYGNNYCYPAGVSLAVMVARVCQVFPASLPSAVVRFFFLFYRQWLGKQTTVSPLFITERLKPDPPPRIHGMWDTWDPQRDACKEDLLPVLNPAYPHNNTCYNVGRSGRDHFYREIVRANAIIQQQQTPATATIRWDDVWPAYRLGDDYNHFMIVEVAEMNGLSSSERQGFDSWALLIESKLKILLFSLECWCEVRMWPKRLSSTMRCQKGRAWAIGVKTGGPDPWTYPIEFLSRIAMSVEEFRFAVEEMGLRGANAFPRVVSSMPSPVCFLMTSLDAGLPEDLMPTPRTTTAKRGRTDD